jgi:4-amino-4-deoxy-L-arabinose transferase-like glycosyltransferase
MQQTHKFQLLIIAAASLVFLTNLGAAQLFDEDEPKNAACAFEMFERGDWVTPTFNGELRTDKPILLYWFTLAAYHVFGVAEFSARITSALAGVGTALLTYHIGRRVFNAEVGLWAGLLLCCSLMFTVASRAATPDGLLIFFSTLAIWLFVAGSFPVSDNSKSASGAKGFPHKRWMYFGMYAAMGMAVLAKGPIGVLLPMAVIGAYLLCLNSDARVSSNGATRGQRTILGATSWMVQTFWHTRIWKFAWRMRPITALLVVSAVALPWYIAVGIQTNGEWPAGFFFKHNFGRYMAPMEGHSGPPFYHVMSVFVGFFPASVFLMPALFSAGRCLRDRDENSAGYLFMLNWILVYVVFFSLAGTKLPSYVTPTHPALAVVTAAFFCRWAREPSRVRAFWQRFPVAILGVVGIGLIAGLTWASVVFMNGEFRVGLIGVIPLVAAVTCFVQIRRRQIGRAVGCFVALSIAFLACGFGWVTKQIEPYQVAGRLPETFEGSQEQEIEVAAYLAFRPSWVFYSRQPVELLREPQQVSSLFQGDLETFIITDSRKVEELLPHLPDDVGVLAQHPRFMKKGKIVVLGRGKVQPISEFPPDRTAQRPSELPR